MSKSQIYFYEITLKKKNKKKGKKKGKKKNLKGQQEEKVMD